MVANYYKPGPATISGDVRHRIANPSWADGACGKWYIDGNVMEGDEKVTKDNWDGGVQPESKSPEVMDSIRRRTPWPAMPIHQQTAEEAYKSVLASAGASLHRDAVDERIISDAREGKATFEGYAFKEKMKMVDKTVNSGIIDSQTDVGGWPELRSMPTPIDSDHDGMPDEWEKSKGLNPQDSTDGAATSSDGKYTNLEVYINSLVEKN